MGGLRMTGRDLAAYELMSRAGSDIKNGMMQYGLSRAADVKPETVSDTRLTETTAGTDGMVYDEDTGQYLPKYMDGGQPTEQAQAQLNTPADGDSEAPQGMRPVFSAKTTTRHKMGDREQDTPFSPEQVDAQRFRNQADVYTRFGMTDKAAAVHGLAKGREEEGIASQIRTAATAGMKGTKDMRDEEKMFAMSKNMYEAAIKMNRPDLATGYYNQMNQNREVLLDRAWDRADRVYRSAGTVSGFVDVQNKHVANGITIPEFKDNADGKGGVWLKTKDEFTGKESEVVVPKEKLGDYLLQLRDIKKVREIEAKRAEILFKAQADSQEALNKPVAVGKDQTLVIPRTGQTFAPGANRGFDVKEAGPILDDARKILLERSGNFDQTSGKWNWSDETRTKAVTAERLFMKNPNLTPAQLAEIADKGTTGTAVVEVGGKQQRVPAVSYGGRTFILGGEAGSETPQPGQPAAPAVKTSGLGTREVRGKIGPAQGGMQKAPATPVQQERVEPVSYNAPELDKIAVAAAEENGVPPRLLLALKNAGEKSNNDQVSKKGAAGVMQFMPETAKAYGVDPTNPESAIKGASRYMADLIKQYRGNVAAAVAHYNGGSTQGALVAAGKSPSYPETRAYLERVLAASGAPA